MKVTKSQLKKIIREELSKALNEGHALDPVGSAGWRVSGLLKQLKEMIPPEYETEEQVDDFLYDANDGVHGEKLEDLLYDILKTGEIDIVDLSAELGF